jgi:TrmH family RNA methyltransferase
VPTICIHLPIVPRPAQSPPVKLTALASVIEFDRLCVILVAARNPLNIGAAARAMSNFGFSRLRVVNPYQVAFREARSAVGASEVLARAEEFKTVAEAVADCALVVGTTAVRHRELKHPLRRLEVGGSIIGKELRSGRVALLFGSEKRGLTNEDLSHCHWLMRIPTRDQHGSMNLGQGVAVCLYELVRTAKAEDSSDQRQLATAAQVERFTTLLLDALRTSGYMKPRSAPATEATVRRLVRRLSLLAGDDEVWLGMLRQMLWRMRTAKDRAKNA